MASEYQYADTMISHWKQFNGSLDTSGINRTIDIHFPKKCMDEALITGRPTDYLCEANEVGRRRATGDKPILTEHQLTELQIQNILNCLKQTGGRVSGENGAAQMMGIKPTTLFSRIKKFGISIDSPD